MINQERLKELLKYIPETGEFTWETPLAYKHKKGDRAGGLVNGYRVIRIGGKNYKATHLAFLYMKGYLPKEVDHKNTVKDDDSWENLRESTRAQNQQNRNKHKNNKTGFKGVEFHNSKYRARLKGKHLGVFDTAEEASAAYVAEAIRSFGEFARG